MTETSCTPVVLRDDASAAWNFIVKCNTQPKGVTDSKSRENLLLKWLCRISSCGGKLRSLLAKVWVHNICRAEEINEAHFR
jgi:hypothetical protein